MIEQQIHHQFVKNSWTLALAESCTGGGIASRLVAIPDCSFYFEGGVVAYSNLAKEKILQVKSSTLENYGAVSEQTAKEMADGALQIFETDFALSTTGIAGPSGGIPQKPIGLVYFSIASLHRDPLVWSAHFQGDRDSIIEHAITEALEKLLTYTV